MFQRPLWYVFAERSLAGSIIAVVSGAGDSNGKPLAGFWQLSAKTAQFKQLLASPSGFDWLDPTG